VNTSYTLNQIRTIYGFPAPTAGPVTVGVFSFGGGLIGTLTNGVLTNGDVQQQWSLLGISAANHPRVLVVSVNGGSIIPDPNDGGATLENTIDVAIIGAMCPIANLTIILYIANPWDNFPVLLTAAMNPTTVNGRTYTPSIISCSWGAPEISFDTVTLNSINSTLQVAASRGITITAASGDNGSSDGTPSISTDFPSSSPYVVACGGTTLRCPSGVYDGSTVEIGWPGSGGGFSSLFDKPSYQFYLPGATRSTPDIALVADPNTGVQFVFNGNPGEVVGGTSIVSPAIAGFAAAIDLKQALTPLLYTYPASTFYDILMGSNGAYTAKTGYDNCTGLGSIVGPALVSNIQSPPSPLAVAGVTLSGLTSLTVGQTITLIATIRPTTAINKTVSFSTSNPRIATVDASGRVTGVGAGGTTITVTTADGSYTAALLITVSSPVINITGITLPATLSIQTGGSQTLTPTLQPTTATNKTVTFISNNTNIATVDASGVVVGVRAGTTVITATTVNGGKVARTTVTVTAPAIRVTGLSLSTTSASIRVNSQFTLVPTVNPRTATNRAVTWSSGNPQIASVNNGAVKALARGSTVITATTVDGSYKATCSIKVA
jgi:uncharacterized protein YjdB